MKKSGQIIMITLISAVASCMAATAFAGSPKEPKLRKETTINEDVKRVVDSAVITDSSVLFIDRAGAVAKSRSVPKGSRVDVSRDGRRIGQQTSADGAASKVREKKKFEMLDDAGNILWATSALTSPVFHVSQANGGSVVARACSEDGPCGNKIIIYDKQHQDGMVVSPPVGAEARSIRSRMSGDGNFIAVVFRTFDEPQPDGSSDLAYYGVAGNQLWIKHFENERIGNVAISPSGSFVAAERRNVEAGECSLMVFSKEGGLVMEQPLPKVGNYVMQFDDGETSLAVASSTGKLFLLDTTTRGLRWEYSTANDKIGFIDVDASAGFVAASVTRRDNPNAAEAPRSLYVFDAEGNLALKKTFANHGFGAWNKGPSVKLRSGGAEILVTLTRQIIVFENDLVK